MATKRNPGRYDCYAAAETDEPMFVLLGRDRHASALVRLWAEMREKENEPAEVVAEARKCAADMAEYAAAKAKPVLALSAVAEFITKVYKPRSLRPGAPAQPKRPAFRPAVDEYVVTKKGNTIGIVTKTFTEEELKNKEGEVQNPDLLDCVQVQWGRAAGSVTVRLENLRPATDDELAKAGYA